MDDGSMGPAAGSDGTATDREETPLIRGEVGTILDLLMKYQLKSTIAS
jgi:hypothetical protein